MKDSLKFTKVRDTRSHGTWVPVTLTPTGRAVGEPINVVSQLESFTYIATLIIDGETYMGTGDSKYNAVHSIFHEWEN